MRRESLYKRVAVIIVLVLGLFLQVSASTFIPSNRDTKMDPSPMVIRPLDLANYETLFENDAFEFAYKGESGVVSITDKRNGYVWKTGIDVLYDRDIDDAIDTAIRNSEIPEYPPKEDRLNTTYTGMANSLFTVEYYDDSNNIKRVSSSSHSDVKNEWLKFDEQHYAMKASFSKIQLQVTLHLYFDEQGMRFEIRDSEITGDGQGKLAAILLTPFLGSTGGQQVLYNEETQNYDIQKPRDMVSGYFLLPDGPGALMRFQNQTSMLNAYVGDVYGKDPSQRPYYYEYETAVVPFKNPTMPVFGVAHGNLQNAFVAYALTGDTHMEIIAVPEENMTFYQWIYPRFEYNHLFYQVYNQRGDGYFTLFDERNHFDISMRYDFLQGDGKDGTPAANYVGMAMQYRASLLERGILKHQASNLDNQHIRLDFIMSDVKKSVLGYEEVVVTTTQQVQDILHELNEEGLFGISVGLHGWQKGGKTLGKPYKASFRNAIGSRRDFESLIKWAKETNIDLSFVQDYTMINDKQMRLAGNAAKHVNGWYDRLYTSVDALPVTSFYYAKPSKSVAWLDKQSRLLEKLGVESMSIEGIGHLLLSEYTLNNKVTIDESKTIIVDGVSKVSDSLNVYSKMPNQYLWSAVDGFLETPVFSTQYLVETDTVPFLQLVLQESIVAYAPYSNFSFYTQKDMLRMIDYHVLPSFVITHEGAHLLSTTNQAHLYSTEYSLYKDAIINAYNQVGGALALTRGQEWMNREVVMPGVIKNTYSGGTIIYINYTDDTMTVDGIKLEPEAYHVEGKGVKNDE